MSLTLSLKVYDYLGFFKGSSLYLGNRAFLQIKRNKQQLRKVILQKKNKPQIKFPLHNYKIVIVSSYKYI